MILDPSDLETLATIRQRERELKNTITVSLTRKVIDALDRIRERSGTARSVMLEEAAQEWLAKRQAATRREIERQVAREKAKIQKAQGEAASAVPEDSESSRNNDEAWLREVLEADE